MACNTIRKYLQFRWVGDVLFASHDVAITHDKDRNCHEIAYLTNRMDENGKVRCAPFVSMLEIDNAVQNAINDGAINVDAIRNAVESVRRPINNRSTPDIMVNDQPINFFGVTDRDKAYRAEQRRFLDHVYSQGPRGPGSFFDPGNLPDEAAQLAGECRHQWVNGAEGAFAGLTEHCSHCGLER